MQPTHNLPVAAEDATPASAQPAETVPAAPSAGASTATPAGASPTEHVAAAPSADASSARPVTDELADIQLDDIEPIEIKAFA